MFSAVEVPDNGVEGGEERLSGRGRGCSQRCRFQITAWKGEGRGGGVVCVIDSLTVVVNGAPTSQ